MKLQFTLISALALATIASAGQTKTTTVFDRITGVQPRVFNTYNVPQTGANPVTLQQIVSENDATPQIGPNDPANNMVAGTQGSYLRIQPNIKFDAIGFTGAFPPDCDMAVGPNHVVTTVNSTIAFYDKATGTQQFIQSLNPGGFFGAANQGDFVSDPKCFYDKISGRFFVVQLDLAFADTEVDSISNITVAVSDDSNPNGVWTAYTFSTKINIPNGTTDAYYWSDYPGWGYNKDALVFSGNMFPFGDNPYGGCMILTIPKPALLNAQPAGAARVRLPNSGTVQIGRMYDPTLDRVYAMERGNGSSVKIHSINNVLSLSPTVSSITMTVPTFAQAQPAVSTGGNQLDPLDGRILNCAYRGNSLVGAHTIAVSAGDRRCACRWYEFIMGTWPTSGTPTLRQAGTVLPQTGEHVWMPAININKFGDIGMIFSRCSSTIPSDIQVCGRKVTDGLGTMSAPQTIDQGSGNYTAGRWGDYFAVDVDPANDAGFWGYAMKIAAGGVWKTTVYSWTVSAIPGSGTGVGLTGINTIVGTFTGGNLASVGAVDGNYYTVDSVPFQGLGQVTSVEVTGQVAANPPPNTIKSLAISLTSSAAKGSTTTVYAFNWNTNAYEIVGQISTPNVEATRVVQVNSPNVAKYVSGSRNVKVLFRTVLPVGNTRPPTVPDPFTHAINKIEMFTNY